MQGNGSKANGESKVLSALYTSEVNRASFTRTIPGMVVGIQWRAEEAQQKRMSGRQFEHVRVYINVPMCDVLFLHYLTVDLLACCKLE